MKIPKLTISQALILYDLLKSLEPVKDYPYPEVMEELIEEEFATIVSYHMGDCYAITEKGRIAMQQNKKPTEENQENED